MTYINRNYFLSQYEDPNTIWQYLSCPEKIAYFQINSKIPFIEGVFSDDINICLKERETLLFLDRASFSFYSLFYEYNFFSLVSDPEQFIYNQVHDGRIVGFNTEFTLIPNYTWYQDEKHRNSPHYSMIVGFDDTDYFVADAPNLIVSEYLQKGNITLIEQKKLLRAFEDRCSFITVIEKDSIINKTVNIKNFNMLNNRKVLF